MFGLSLHNISSRETNCLKSYCDLEKFEPNALKLCFYRQRIVKMRRLMENQFASLP